MSERGQVKLENWRDVELLACKPKPIVCLPLMTKPAREVEKSTKYLPEVWTCAELRLKNDG